jgi:predicted Ser/Thr protein kinase
MADPSDDELAHTATAPGTPKARAAATPLGETLGRYRLERTLGEGGMGIVHAAFDPDLERRVALKVLRVIDRDGEARQRLLREARAMARLTHANVVTVHEVGTAGDRDYVAMELIDGETLADWLRGEHTTDEIVAAFVAAGRGLAAAHAAGLVHRDFKPHNVLRRRDGRIVVTDFGLARGVEAGPAIALDTTVKLGSAPESTPSSLSGLTATGSVLGTPAYMAPEQWTGGTVGPAADQFGFCVALWEALTGERPFRGDTIERLKEEVKRGPAALDASKLPRRLRRILRRGLDPDPSARYPNMDALLAALSRSNRRLGLAVATAGGVAVAAGTLLVALGGDHRASCDPPAVDPGHAWSDAMAATMPKPMAEVFKHHVERWAVSRATACTAEPTERQAQLRCLDGVLARFEVVRQTFPGVPKMGDEDVLKELVDPSTCLTPTPPRFAITPTPDLVAAYRFHAQATPENEHATVADVQAFSNKPGLDACSRAIAMLALHESAADFPTQRAAITEAVATSDQCDDDRLHADLLLEAIPYQFELPVIGPKGEAAIRRADAAVQRLADPVSRARIDFFRAYIAAQQEHWKDAFDLSDHAIDTFERAGMLRRAVAIELEALEMRFNRGEPSDLAAVRAAVARWLPIARRLPASEGLARQLERGDALARYTQGEVAAAHAELLRLWQPAHDDPGRKLEGDVVDRAGKPVAGATVAAASQLVADSIGVPLPIYRLHRGDGHLRVVTTDANGHFTIPDGPEAGAIIAQLGDRRSVATPIADHVKLVVQPTRRLSGKVALGKLAATQAMIAVDDPSDHTDHFQLIAPVMPDGTFAIDGVPTGKVQIGVAVDRSGFGTKLDYTPVPASTEAVTNLSLGVASSERALDVIARSTLTSPLDTAQIIILPGKVQLANVGELITQTGLAGLLTQFARHVVGEQVPHEAIDKLRPGDLVAHFTDVPAGEITVCAIGLSGDMMDTAVMRKVQAHVAELELKCETVGGDTKLVVVAAPPQKRFD